MNVKLIGNFIQHLEVELLSDEDFYAQKGALIYLEKGIEKGKAEVLKIAAETMLSFGIDKKLIEERLGVKLDTLILPSNL